MQVLFKLFLCSVMSGLQHFSQVHGHLCPGGGAPPLGVSSVLDLHNVLWLKVPWGGDPGREGSGEQHPLEDIQRQVGGGVAPAVPLGGVLMLLAAPQHRHFVPEVRLPEGLFWLEAREDGPGSRGGGWRLLSGDVFVLQVTSWLVFWIRTEALGVVLAHQDSGGEFLQERKTFLVRPLCHLLIYNCLKKDMEISSKNALNP